MAALRVLLQLTCGKSIQAIEPEPHVRHAGGHEDARGRTHAQHALHQLPHAVAQPHTVEHRKQLPQLDLDT
jgi:hypothetical protein